MPTAEKAVPRHLTFIWGEYQSQAKRGIFWMPLVGLRSVRRATACRSGRSGGGSTNAKRRSRYFFLGAAFLAAGLRAAGFFAGAAFLAGAFLAAVLLVPVLANVILLLMRARIGSRTVL